MTNGGKREPEVAKPASASAQITAPSSSLSRSPLLDPFVIRLSLP